MLQLKNDMNVSKYKVVSMTQEEFIVVYF